MTKLKAFASHLGISFVIFLAILSLLIFAWFPPPFFTSDGGWQGIRIIAGVDLVLGPLLTLIVFKPGKPGLKFDLTVIGIIQISALAWGIWMLHHERPVAAVFADGYFTPVTFNDIRMYGMTSDKLHTFGSKAPYWIFSELPQDPGKLQKVRIEALRSGQPISRLVDYYRPMDVKAVKYIRGKSIDMQKWLQNKPAQLNIYRQFLRKQANKSDLVFLPWRARNKYDIIAINVKTRKYVGSLGMKPPDPDSNYPVFNAREKNPKSAGKQAPVGQTSG
jgi:hypothetical protein